jgi:hypothetical protein
VIYSAGTRCGGGFSETIYINNPGVILREPQLRNTFFAGSSTCVKSLREKCCRAGAPSENLCLRIMGIKQPAPFILAERERESAEIGE